jgi:hypothetical protein
MGNRSGEPTVREYDRDVCEKIKELQRGTSILWRAIEKQCVNHEKLRAILELCEKNAHDVIAQYNLISVSYIAYDCDDNGTKFAHALSCAGIDALIVQVGANVADAIVCIQEAIGVVSVPKSRGSAKSRSAVSRETCAMADTSELRGILRTAMGHISRATLRGFGAPNSAGSGSGSLVCDECGAKLRVLQDAHESVCDNCGRILPIVAELRDANIRAGVCACVGGMFQVSADHGNIRARRGGYNFVRHLKIWLDRLQAIESDEFATEDIARIRTSIISEHVSSRDVCWRALTCDDIARHLSLCGLSYLGEHVPKLLKELGGRAPPILDYDAEQIIVRDFTHIMETYTRLFQGPGNKPYYPFFVGKIIRRRFARDSETRRILEYITRQGHETVNRHDKIYKRICDAAPSEFDLVFEPETA